MSQDLGSKPASIQAGKMLIAMLVCPDNGCQQSDAEQAYVQARLKGIETWIALPREAWPDHWLNEDGTPTYDQPVARLLRALYGHPGAGTFWEQHCDKVIVKKRGVIPIETWPSCYDMPSWMLLLSV